MRAKSVSSIWDECGIMEKLNKKRVEEREAQ
jgi:hypothetical protein